MANTPTSTKKRRRDYSLPPPVGERGSSRGTSSLSSLASILLDSSKKSLIISGAGLSVASGIPTFRGSADSIWSQSLWTNATRSAFQKDPLRWWNDFWLEFFPIHYDGYLANEGHKSIAAILRMSKNCNVITQNVDGLQQGVEAVGFDWKDRLIQAHGVIGLYKCVNDGDDELVSKSWSRSTSTSSTGDGDGDGDGDDKKMIMGDEQKKCIYAYSKSLEASELLPLDVRTIILCEDEEEKGKLEPIATPAKTTATTATVNFTLPPELPTAPTCPCCKQTSIIPQALMFDEGYDSHTFYQFDRIQELLEGADCIIFVGTSLAVTLTDLAMKEARRRNVDVFNFNLEAGR